MSLRSSLKNLIRRDAERPSLRERAADLQAGLSRVARPPAAPQPVAEPAPDFAAQVVQAGPAHDVLAGGGIDHRDGTVSYADATGQVSRRPMAHWIGFNALQMHNRVRSEIGRRRVLEANHLPGGEHEAWEARIRRELRADAVHALAFRHDRAFEAAQAIRTGVEPATQALREQADAELLALAPAWEAALDLYQRLSDEESLIGETASEDGWPGPAPDGAGPEWRAWFRQKEDWRERTGVASAEEASGEAGTALFRIEEQIADLPAASLAGLKLKARVAQRSDDIDVEWVFGLGQGLVRDILAFTAPTAVDWYDPPPGFMASPALEPSSFVPVADGIARDLARLRGAAWAEFHRRVSPETKVEDIRRIRRELHLDTLSPSLPKSGIVDQVDLAAASLNELRTIHEKMRHLSDVAYAMGAQGCCERNAAGDLMLWLADELTTVESKVADEMQRRQPAEFEDRKTRLAAVAERIIYNGDDDETATFVRDLAGFAAEQAGR